MWEHLRREKVHQLASHSSVVRRRPSVSIALYTPDIFRIMLRDCLLLASVDGGRLSSQSLSYKSPTTYLLKGEDTFSGRHANGGDRGRVQET